MNKKPFFSIVLPTLNRANYISLAIQSVLNQTFGDFELIVSDNSSTDNTEEIVKGFLDERIRYVKTEKILPMYESWEFALNHAGGEYITFLGDDDAHSLIYLESFKEIIEKYDAQLVCCRMAEFYYKSNSLVTVPFNNELLECNSQRAIEDIFVFYGLSKNKATANNINLPQLINTVYHNSVFERIKNKLGRVIPRILSTDYYLLVAALNFTEKYYYQDSPLSFHGSSAESTTLSISNKKKGASLKDTQPELAVLSNVPLNIFVPYNFAMDALLTAKSDLGDSLDFLDLDFTGYFIYIYRLLHALELEGIDVSDETREFTAVLSRQDQGMQKEVNSVILDKKFVIGNNLRRKFNNTIVYRYLRSFRDQIKGSSSLTIEGKKVGFENIAECAKFIDRNFLKSYQNKER